MVESWPNGLALYGVSQDSFNQISELKDSGTSTRNRAYLDISFRIE